MTKSYDIDEHTPDVVFGSKNLGGHTVAVLFHWSTEHGACQDCGLPAAFTADYYRDELERLCAVCAADAATLGYTIARIEDQ